jgi:hypothetical protein
MPARDRQKHKETHSTPGTVAVTRHAFHRALEIPTFSECTRRTIDATLPARRARQCPPIGLRAIRRPWRARTMAQSCLPSSIRPPLRSYPEPGAPSSCLLLTCLSTPPASNRRLASHVLLHPHPHRRSGSHPRLGRLRRARAAHPAQRDRRQGQRRRLHPQSHGRLHPYASPPACSPSAR